MAENSAIEWTHHTFNHVRGCTKVSEGCKNCYAETMSHRNPGTLGVWGPNGTRVVASDSMWREPVKWDKKAKSAGVRHRVFCASLADVFEDWKGPEDDGAMTCHKTGESLSINQRGHVWPMGWPSMSDGDDWGCRPYTMDDVRARLFRLIEATPSLDWLLLTKRPENITRMVPADWQKSFPPNVWIGTSVENQQTADERIPHLLTVPAKVRFLSCEPLLGPVDLRFWRGDQYGGREMTDAGKGIHWVITGGESGPGHRDCDPAWQSSIVDQCDGAGVPVFVKQDSGRTPGHQGRIPLAVWDHKAFPEVTP